MPVSIIPRSQPADLEPRDLAHKVDGQEPRQLAGDKRRRQQTQGWERSAKEAATLGIGKKNPPDPTQPNANQLPLFKWGQSFILFLKTYPKVAPNLLMCLVSANIRSVFSSPKLPL